MAGRLIDARLGCLDGCLLRPSGLAAAGGTAEVGAVDGVSTLCIGKTRIVRGPADMGVGIGCEVLIDDSVIVDAERAEPACDPSNVSVVVEILSFPGCCRFMPS